MRALIRLSLVLLMTALVCSSPSARPEAQLKKDYLSEAEADKIRDAGTAGPRIVLYANFAADRIKKLQYEFAHMDPNDKKRTDRLNYLINSYTGCVDDGVDQLDLGIEKQQDIRAGVKVFQARINEFLPYLRELAANGPERETYKENLDDALEATQDAAKELENVAKEMAPPPVRRKPS